MALFRKCLAFHMLLLRDSLQLQNTQLQLQSLQLQNTQLQLQSAVTGSARCLQVATRLCQLAPQRSLADAGPPFMVGQ